MYGSAHVRRSPSHRECSNPYASSSRFHPPPRFPSRIHLLQLLSGGPHLAHGNHPRAGASPAPLRRILPKHRNSLKSTHDPRITTHSPNRASLQVSPLISPTSLEPAP